MPALYDEIIKKSYNSCKRLENIVMGIIDNLENDQYRKVTPMSKQLLLASRATGVLASITDLAQILKSEGAVVVDAEEPKVQDPRIPGLLERLKKLREENN